ncbi:MAG: permease [Gemmatales bacterium]|nr:permease [Gemmatales bacterium]
MLEGFLIRFGQTIIEASITLSIGFLVAAVCRRALGAEGVRQLFGGGQWSSLLRAWLIGTLLPVCSLGLIPVIRELRRCGVPQRTLLAFVLATPQLNPLSLLYGLTLAEPSVLGAFIICNLSFAVLGGWLWARFYDRPEDLQVPEPEPLPEPGERRLAAIVLASCRAAVSPALGYVLLGVLNTACVAMLLPFGSLSWTMRHDQWWAPELMLAVGTLVYSGVLPGMMRITSMFDHGNSVGAAFLLFQVGIGWNVGLAAWLIREFGPRRMGLWMATLFALMLVLAHAMEFTLYFAHTEADHTHAFDDWTRPQGASLWPEWSVVQRAWLDRVGVLEPVGIVTLGLLLVGGVIVRVINPNQSWDEALCTWRRPPGSQQSLWHRPLPGWVTGSVALVILIALSIMGLYLYYPDSQQGFREIARIRADAYSAIHTGNVAEAIRQLEFYDLWLRKTQIGILLRSWQWNHELAQATQDLRQHIERLRDLLLAGEMDQAKAYVATVEKVHRRCREAYRQVETAGQ